MRKSLVALGVAVLMLGTFGWRLIDSLIVLIDGTITVTRGHGTAVAISISYRERAA